MKSSKVGTNTSQIEILNISASGLWILVKGKEYFLPYKEFPWFQNARVFEIQHVQLLRGRHLYWDKLDIDLDLDSLEFPDRYPLKSRYPKASHRRSIVELRGLGKEVWKGIRPNRYLKTERNAWH